jgi:tRNA pseudouridine13 synthase
VLDVLARRGAPNYFGAQRFGARGDTARLGEALIRGEADAFIAMYLGRPQDGDPPDCKAARDAFDAGALDRALRRWPRHYVNERKALAAYKKKRRPGPAITAIDKRIRRLYVSAFQSTVFNDVLARRIESIDRVLDGDLAQLVGRGAVFRVEDVRAEQLRADRFEISPTGPLPGARMTPAGGEAGRIEQNVLREHGVLPGRFDALGPLKPDGARRALRFALDAPALTAGEDKHGPLLELTFGAPSGCYATVVVEEIAKNRTPYTRD